MPIAKNPANAARKNSHSGSYPTTLLTLAVLLSLMLLPQQQANAHALQPPPSLTGVPVPAVPGLLSGADRIVINKTAAIALGKALFWDMNMGSDGVACASCHFHAGADIRNRNQLTTGENRTDGNSSGSTFQKTASGRRGSANYLLHQADFPLHQFADPGDASSQLLFSTDDVIGSAGTFGGTFVSSSTSGAAPDTCNRQPEAPYIVNGVGTRHVTQRNAPSVINAAYNHRNFWDGRANNIFNGRNPFGNRDPNAFIWVRDTNNTIIKQRLALRNSSLASQASGPPLDSTEMSCAGRTFADVGRRLLRRRALELQTVHAEDSVLASYRNPTGKGLNITYDGLIRAAFAPRYWGDEAPKAQFGKPKVGVAYTFTEANFSMFLGLSVQLYISTLVSDKTPFDAPRVYDANRSRYYPEGFNEQQKNGEDVFLDAHCFDCHGGPTLSMAAYPATIQYYGDSKNLVNISRKYLYSGFGLVDIGYANTGVVANVQDPGLGGNDPFGNPLALTDQYLQILMGKPEKVTDPIAYKTCNLDSVIAFTADFKKSELKALSTVGCLHPELAFEPTVAVAKAEYLKPKHGRLRSGVTGAFKIPTLRNVELTGPYMHNGSMATLEQVAEFYGRGGNYFNEQIPLDSIFPQGFSQQNIADLVVFLKTMTDERIRWEKAPFDHPSLQVAQGHVLSQPDANHLAKDAILTIPAIGKKGRDTQQGPLKPFNDRLSP